MIKNGFFTLLVQFIIAGCLIFPSRFGLFQGSYEIVSFENPVYNLFILIAVIIIYIVAGRIIFENLGSRKKNILSLLPFTLIGVVFFVLSYSGILAQPYSFFIAPFLHLIFIIGVNAWRMDYPQWLQMAYILGCSFYPVLLIWVGLEWKARKKLVN